MTAEMTKASKRVLEPSERIAEVLFGLIMVLTFTGSLSVAEADRAEVRTMLIGALGCNIAWGIIDGILYLMGCLADKGRERLICPRGPQRRRSATGAASDRGRLALSRRLCSANCGARNDSPAAKATARVARSCPLAQGQLAGGRRRFSLGIPIHVSGGDSVPFHAKRRAGSARFQRDRHRDAVLDRLCLWEVRRAPAVADWHFDGRPRRRPCRTHDGARWVRRVPWRHDRRELWADSRQAIPDP